MPPIGNCCVSCIRQHAYFHIVWILRELFTWQITYTVSDYTLTSGMDLDMNPNFMSYPLLVANLWKKFRYLPAFLSMGETDQLSFNFCFLCPRNCCLLKPSSQNEGASFQILTLPCLAPASSRSYKMLSFPFNSPFKFTHSTWRAMLDQVHSFLTGFWRQLLLTKGHWLELSMELTL